MTEPAATATCPAIEVRDAILSMLAAAGDLSDLPAGSIRAKLDVSGVPRGPASVIVSARDLGNHAGIPGRILVDVQAIVQIMTHLDEDMSGALADSLMSAAMAALGGATAASYSLNGWKVGYPGQWASDEPYIDSDGVFRVCRLSATLFLQKTN